MPQVADPPQSSSALAFSVARAAADSAQFSAELVRCGSLPLLFDLQAAGLRGVPEQAAVSGWCCATAVLHLELLLSMQQGTPTSRHKTVQCTAMIAATARVQARPSTAPHALACPVQMLRLGVFVNCMAAIAARLVTTAQAVVASAAHNGTSSGRDSGVDSSGGASASGSGGSSDNAAIAQLRRAVAGVSNLPGELHNVFEIMLQQTASADPRANDPRLMCVALGQLWVERGPQQRSEQLVAALQAAWSQPAALEREQVEVAEVAAVGRCAYLGCSNLGGEGGMAAGEGVGSKRCRCEQLGWGGVGGVDKEKLATAL